MDYSSQKNRGAVCNQQIFCYQRELSKQQSRSDDNETPLLSIERIETPNHSKNNKYHCFQMESVSQSEKLDDFGVDFKKYILQASPGNQYLRFATNQNGKESLTKEESRFCY